MNNWALIISDPYLRMEIFPNLLIAVEIYERDLNSIGHLRCWRRYIATAERLLENPLDKWESTDPLTLATAFLRYFATYKHYFNPNPKIETLIGEWKNDFFRKTSPS